MLLAALAASALAAPEPTVNLWSLFTARFFLNGPEATMMIENAEFSFAPAGDVDVKMQVRAGSELLDEPIFSRLYRVDSVAVAKFRVKSIKLGTTPGPRSIDLIINGKSAGRLDFDLKKAATGWETTGPWATHAQIRWEDDGRPNNRVRFDYWAAGTEMPDAKAPFKAVFKRAGKVLAEGSEKYPSGAMWVKRTDNLKRPDGSFVTVGDMAKLGDGPIVVEIVQAGKTVKSYRCSMSGGKFAPHPRSSEALAAGTAHLPVKELSGGLDKLGVDAIIWLAP